MNLSALSTRYGFDGNDRQPPMPAILLFDSKRHY